MGEETDVLVPWMDSMCLEEAGRRITVLLAKASRQATPQEATLDAPPLCGPWVLAERCPYPSV